MRTEVPADRLAQRRLEVMEMARMLEVSDELFLAASAAAQETAEQPEVVLERWATVGRAIYEAYQRPTKLGTKTKQTKLPDVVQRMKDFMKQGNAANVDIKKLINEGRP